MKRELLGQHSDDGAIGQLHVRHLLRQLRLRGCGCDRRRRRLLGQRKPERLSRRLGGVLRARRQLKGRLHHGVGGGGSGGGRQLLLLLKLQLKVMLLQQLLMLLLLLLLLHL